MRYVSNEKEKIFRMRPAKTPQTKTRTTKRRKKTITRIIEGHAMSVRDYESARQMGFNSRLNNDGKY